MKSKSKKSRNGMVSKFQKIARAMSRNWNVQVIATGATCATDGGRIAIPFNADYLPENDQQILNGMLDHEVSHVAEERSHKEAGKPTPMEIVRGLKSKKEKMLINVFEDIRIETKYSKLYPGMAENMSANNLHAVGMLREKAAKGQMTNFWHTFGCGIISAARGEATDWIPAQYRPFMDAVQEEIDASVKTVWAEDSLELARAVIEKIGDTANELEEEQKRRNESDENDDETDENGESGGSAGDDEDGKGGGEGESEGETDDEPEWGDFEDEDEDGEGEGEGEGETDGENTENGGETDGDSEDGEGEGEGEGEGDEDGDEGMDSGDGESGDDEDGEGETDGDEDGEGETDGDAVDRKRNDDGSDEVEGDGEGHFHDMDDDDLEAALKAAEDSDGDSDVEDVLDDVKDELNKDALDDAVYNKRYIPNPNVLARDRWVKPNVDGPHHARLYKADKNRVNDQIRGLKGKLIGVILGRAAATVEKGKRRGKLDRRALHRVPVGAKDVFKTMIEGETLDTAVSVLVDLSGSMGDGSRHGSKARYAKLTALALSETFSALNVPFEVIGFHNDWDEHIIVEPGTVRTEPLEMVVYKGFDEKYTRCKYRLNTITGHGNNTDGEAVLAVAKRLHARIEERKILIVISDGMPRGGGVDAGMLEKNLRETVDLVTSVGIETVGIGVQTRAVQSFYNESTGAKNVVINDLDKLAVDVYKVMREFILKRRAKKAA